MGPAPSTFAFEAAVFTETSKITGVEPGEVEEGVTLHAEFTGAPLQVSSTVLVKAAPRELRLRRKPATPPEATVACSIVPLRLKSAASPDRLALSGLPVALLAIASVPVRVPEAVGVKTTLKLQLEPADSAPGQLFVWEKSPLI